MFKKSIRKMKVNKEAVVLAESQNTSPVVVTVHVSPTSMGKFHELYLKRKTDDQMALKCLQGGIEQAVELWMQKVIAESMSFDQSPEAKLIIRHLYSQLPEVRLSVK